MPIKTITMNSVRELMETPGPCLTLVCNANGGLRTALNTLRRNYPGNEELLNPVQEAVEALPGNGRAPKQVAVLSSPSTMIVCHVSESVKPIAQIANHFDLRTLLEIAGAQRSFYILALSQNRTRLLACTQDSSEEVALPAGTPASLAESMQTRKPDHVLKNMNSAGPSHGSMKGVMSGTSTDREDKDEYVLHFFQALDRAVNAVL